MKAALYLFACLSVALAFPQKEGAAFSNDAIRQAQTSSLIPADAKIENVQEGVELVAVENIPGSQRIDLAALLGAEVPFEVISNLQGQIDSVGRS